MNLGLFEVLAADDSDRRLASRKALVLARTRIDERLGRFLGSAKSQDEFDARYALVGTDFANLVHVACDEVGHEDSWALVKTLHAHYRTAGKPPWLKDDEDDDSEPGEDDEGDDDNDEKTSSTVADYLSSHYASDDEMRDEDIACKKCGEKGGTKNSTGHCTDCQEEAYKKATESNPVESSVHTADEGNTGLGGPSPKINKQRWTPKSITKKEIEDATKSDRNPTVVKDVTEAMPRKNEGPPGDIGKIDEIGALTTTETLPTATNYDDAGFAGNNMPSGPHTDQWGDSGQTEPVKSDALAA